VPVLGEADEAPLDGGGASAVGDDPVAAHARADEFVREHAPRGVLADDAEGLDFRVQRDEVHADVRSPAREPFLSADLQDGHGRVAGQTLSVPVDQLVEHKIAHNEHAERAPVRELFKDSCHAAKGTSDAPLASFGRDGPLEHRMERIRSLDEVDAEARVEDAGPEFA